MHRHGLTWLAILGLIALMFMRLPQRVVWQDSVLHTYSALVEVDALARQQYVEVIDDDRLVHGAIRGMIRQLDPYSGYISPKELPAFERRNEGQYVGVGIEIGAQSGQLTIISPIEGSPAVEAGVLAGDVIVAINGKETKGLSVFDAEELLLGAGGTKVEIHVRRPGWDEIKSLVIVRGPVTIHTVRGFRRYPDGGWDHWLDRGQGIGYIRVSNFLRTTMRDLDAALRELSGPSVRALILDLRFDPGGLMDQAIAMVDRFVEEGVILSTVTRRNVVEEFRAKEPEMLRHLELVILINGGSASSAEIVAGSLQDHGRAVIVGERSFGKGSVQHLIPLHDQAAAVKLTTAYYRLPKGRMIHRTERNAATDSWGVIPDLEVLLSDEEARAIQRARRTLDLAFSDSDLAGTDNPSTHEDEASSTDDSRYVPRRPLELPKDRQLLAALEVLNKAIPPRKGGGL